MSSHGKETGYPSATAERGASSSGAEGEGRRRTEARQYKGVRMRKWGSWVAEVRLPGSRERIWLGSHDTAEKAARAYDAAVLCVRGPGATFNFPESLPQDVPHAGSGLLTPGQIRDVADRHARGPVAPAREAEPAERAEEAGGNTIVGGERGMLDWLDQDPLAGFPSPEWTVDYGVEDDDPPDDSGEGDGCGLWSFGMGDGPPSAST